MASSQVQLNQLVEFAKDRSESGRSKLFRTLASLYLTQPNALSEQARRTFDQLLASLCLQADFGARRDVAAKVLETPAPPKELLLALAHSELEIAAPILRSPLNLTDRDLVQFIDEGEPSRLTAIAARKKLSEPVVNKLVATGHDAVYLAIARNQDVTLSAGAMLALVNKARQQVTLQEPLLARYDLPPYLLIRMFFFIAGDLRKELLARADMIEPALVRDAMDSTRDGLLAPSQEDSAELSEARHVVADKADQGRVDDAFLGALIEAREHKAVLIAFAYITGVDFRSAKIIFKDSSYESLVIACRASKISRDMFAALAQHVPEAQTASGARGPAMLNLYEKISPEIAERLMRFWRLRARASADAAKIASLLRDVEGLSDKQ
ncbi:DUF2336 domain-containing protein [Hyphococcus flavus]|uniref:DUF2336 domain-containing protein n=1 Tax=Hyphococcus flavus TaxID=1866326 RepID=A0AAE9ZG99_9PROT|nr:DUF2336 domain-containing protein [Hyphococcus flavus]WDI32207.1 DUF2336 domain-containing protein [Hyphococcus flavus]